MLVKRYWGIYFLMLGAAGVGCQLSEDADSTLHPMNADTLERQPARKAPDFGAASVPAAVANGTVRLDVNPEGQPEGHPDVAAGTHGEAAPGVHSSGLMADDSDLDSAPDSAPILVATDDQPPSFSGCEDITREAGFEQDGAYVSHRVTANDDHDGWVPVVCDVSFPTYVPIGASQPITCTSTDSTGNQASCSFLFTVVAPAACEGAAPRSQDYWRTQCNYRAPDGTLPDPTMPADVFDDLLDRIQIQIENVCDMGESACEALNPEPWGESCESACQQYAAILLNIEAGLLPTSCCTIDGTVGQLADHIAGLISNHECYPAINLGYELNRGCAFCTY